VGREYDAEVTEVVRSFTKTGLAEYATDKGKGGGVFLVAVVATT
jgi:hypothetical protein